MRCLSLDLLNASVPGEIWLRSYWKAKTVWNIIGKNRKIGTLTFSQWSISQKIIFTQFFVQIATSLIFDLSKVLFIFILPKWCFSFIFLRWCFFFAFFLYCSAIAHQLDLIGGYFFFWQWLGVVKGDCKISWINWPCQIWNLFT